ncbi:MAG: peptidylprolyl isomerase [Verrucomicrobiales bacterium]
MMNLKPYGLLLALALASSAFAQETPATPKPEPAKAAAEASKEVAVLETSEGQMVVEFWPEVAPKTVENFKKLAQKDFYNGTAFHRIVKGFMIQGGDPNTKDLTREDSYGTGDPGYKIKAEFNDRPHTRGVLSMARSRDVDSAGSQFFICLARAPHLDGQYTAFGKVIKGDDVLGKIGDIPTTIGGNGERSKPRKRIELKSVKIVPLDSLEKKETAPAIDTAPATPSPSSRKKDSSS